MMFNRMEFSDKFLNFRNETFKIFNIVGCFGLGKSYLTNELCDSLKQANQVDLFLFLNTFEHTNSMTDLSFRLISGLIDPDGENLETEFECEFYSNLFYDKINTLSQSDQQVFNNIKKFNKPVSISEIGITHTLQKSIRNYEFSTKTEERLFKRNGEVAVEALFIDLLTVFLNINHSESFPPAIGEEEKKRVFIILDNADSISGTLNEWIYSTFLTYLDKKFFEYKSYSFEETGSNYSISDYLDIRMVLTSRQPIAQLDDSIVCTCELKPFSEHEISDFLNKYQIKIDESFEFICDLTKGIPYILNLLSEYLNIGTLETDYTLIYYHAAEKILRDYDNDKKDWIRYAAFLNEFDEWGLRCFPSISDDYKKAFEILKRDDFLTDKLENGKIKIKDILKDYICKSVLFSSYTVSAEIRKIADAYYGVDYILERFDNKQKEIFRKLAYFKQFDLEYSLEQFFADDAPDAIELIQSNKDLFVVESDVYSLSPELNDLFLKLNSLIDLDDYYSYLEKSETISNNIPLFNLSKLKEFESSLKNFESLKIDLNNKIEQTHSQVEILKNQINIFETDLKFQTDRKDTIIGKKRTSNFLYYGFAAIISLVLSIFSKEIFSVIFMNSATIGLIRSFFYTITAITGLLTIKELITAFVYTPKKYDVNLVNEKIMHIKVNLKDLNEKIESYYNKEINLRAKLDTTENSISIVGDRMQNLKKILNK
ncbi:MAG: hypothetical protein NT007_09340 [Candidatus Kapabacteria bacterium]|nr:hypothetical protein [Candidatus Kapabacteria bacterium]